MGAQHLYLECVVILCYLDQVKPLCQDPLSPTRRKSKWIIPPSATEFSISNIRWLFHTPRLLAITIDYNPTHYASA